MSAAVSAQYDVGCPRCGAQAFEPCRSARTRRVTDTHAARMDRWGLKHGWTELMPEEQR